MKLYKYKCLIRMGSAGTEWKVVEPESSFAVKQEFVLLYGREKLKEKRVFKNFSKAKMNLRRSTNFFKVKVFCGFKGRLSVSILLFPV